ncbi:MAG: hypothetical protein CGW95_00935 [Phenylobacterium zucineum]|nr:MAG: hypothetical protein CGW95_00935 [Phenylobacterium zucineum]
MKTEEMQVADAVSYAYGIIEELASECREVVDNASGTPRENTQRIQTLDETAGTLENQQEPEVLDTERRVKFQVHPDKRRGLSRQKRLDNAISAIEAVIADMDELIEALPEDDEEARPAAESLRDDLDNTLGEVQGVEFPGMYG